MKKDMSKDGMKWSFRAHTKYALAKDRYTSTFRDKFLALAFAVRDRLVERWIKTQQRYHKKNVKRVYYLSMEFLIGRLLDNYTHNLGIENQTSKALEELELDAEEMREQEPDAGLGNGGLGRLAACFLDSMATLGIAAHGYGIRYDYGIFTQKIKDGHQIELPDEWLRLENPWEFARPEYTVTVHFYGGVKTFHDKLGKLRAQWTDTQDVLAVPYDVPIPGYKNDVVNTLRLWSARSTNDFNLDYFNHGDYECAVQDKIQSEIISKVLYPNDNVAQGRELRLKQEYFFTAAAISDIIRRFKSENSDFRDLPKKAAIQLNDTHPALAIVELMRILLDEVNFDWETAWDIVVKTFAYTNHTLLPEALEKWDVPLFENLLPRHLQIIHEMNARFLNTVSARFPGDNERLKRMSLIDETEPKRVRMSHIAIVGSHSVNGVSALHSELLQNNLFKDFFELEPTKFNNKTNGITQRRWLLKANPKLSGLIKRSIGDGWVTDLEKLKGLVPFAEKDSFLKEWRKIKLDNKRALSDHLFVTMGARLDTESLFDVQIKRMHEYKRQLLFAFYVISQYLRIKNDPKSFIQPRTFLIAGKAAPGYQMAKLIIKFIHSVSDVINRDKAMQGKINLLFVPNYSVSLAERLFPASELSEQISTAGTEASGTGNMKFMLNGALTIGTLDGANVEMAEALGNKDMFIFGLKANEVQEVKNRGYNPQDYISKSPVLQEIVNLMQKNFFSLNQHGLFNPILDYLLGEDRYLVAADFDAYLNMQDEVSRAYRDRNRWTKMSIRNTASSGRFSSDRTIQQYAREVWGVLGKDRLEKGVLHPAVRRNK